MLSNDFHYICNSFLNMENWEIDFRWLRLRHFIKNTFGRDELPDLQVVLFLIGIQEANVSKERFSKEEKQDLIHIATCHLLSQYGYYEFVGKDEDGWPHYDLRKAIPFEGFKAQEKLLKECIIKYFNHYDDLIEEYEK